MRDSRSFATAVRVAVLASFTAIASACGGGGGGGNGGDGGSVSIAEDLASVSPTPQEAAFESGAGAFAADYLRRTNFTSIVVEVDYPANRPPSAAALDLLEARLAQRCDKPDGVTVFVDDAIPVNEFPSVLSIDDLDALESVYRESFSDLASNTAALYVLYVHGESDIGGGNGSTQVLGLNYHGGSVALFVDAAEQGADLQITTAEVEGTGLVHEAGHCLGLTGGSVPMLVDHRDDVHGFHDTSAASVMYWIVSVPLIAPNLGDATFADFDQNSKNDLAAFGGAAAFPALFGSSEDEPASADAFDFVPVGFCPHCVGADCAAR